MSRHSLKKSVKQECHDTTTTPPEDQEATHSVATLQHVSRHSFQRTIAEHHKDNVAIGLGNTRLEGSVATLKLMSQQSKFNFKGKIFSWVSRQHHNIAPRYRRKAKCRDTQTNVTTHHLVGLHKSPQNLP